MSFLATEHACVKLIEMPANYIAGIFVFKELFKELFTATGIGTNVRVVFC